MNRIFATMMALLVCGVTTAATINVPADYTTIQAAVDAASDGDTIAIAAGTYFERDINTNGKAILISGAVDADGAPAAIIDGQEQLGTVLVCNSGENAETIIENLMVINAFGVRGAAMACIESSPTIQNCVFRNGFCAYGGGIYCESSSPTISGCTISGNTAHVNGGGIYCESSSPAISGCTISGNTAKFDDDYYGGGGGIYCYESSPTLTDCVISDNSANLCGGIYCQNDSNPTLTNCEISGNTADSHSSGIACWDSSPTISSCTISGNTATYNCGGISFIGNSSPTLSDCTISGNTADYGGGIFASDTSNATLTNCTISGNTAHGNGGGIYCQSYSNLTLIDTNVCGNDIDQIYGVWTNGGGVCIAFACEDWDDDGVPDKCQGSIGDGIHEVPSEYATIQSAIEAAGYGDTVLVGPGTYTNTGNWVINPGGKPITIQSTDGPEVTILDGEGVRRVVQCAGGETAATTIEGFTITGGSAYYGGGIYFAGGNPTLTVCVIDGNTAEYNGGGIYCYKCSPTLTDCEISNNTAEYDGWSSDGGGGGIYCYINSSPAITDCTITNNTAWYGGGIHSVFSNGNPTLAYTTVCGNTLDQIKGSWTDNGGNTIADECPDCPDINGDGEVGVDEILAVIAAWGTDDADADVNDDGIVDTNDILLVLSAWGPCE